MKMRTLAEAQELRVTESCISGRHVQTICVRTENFYGVVELLRKS